MIGLDRRQLTAVFAGGCAGAVLRYGLGEALPAGPGAWPWATLIANLAGAFAIGWAATLLSAASARAQLIGPGLCGALTTFSTLQLELLRMLDRDELALAAAYVAVSVTAGLAVVLAGSAAARRSGAARVAEHIGGERP